MPLTATASSAGDTLRQEVVIDGRHRLVTDEPERLGGGDEGPAPHELVPAALAACVVTTIRSYARTKGWNVGPILVDVVYDHKSTPRRFDVAPRCEAARKRRSSGAHTCPGCPECPGRRGCRTTPDNVPLGPVRERQSVPNEMR